MSRVASRSRINAPLLVLVAAVAFLTALIAPAPESASGQQPLQTTYVVRAGDTLSGIAARFDTTVSALAVANQIADPRWISEGQRLAVPAARVRPVSVQPSAATVSPAQRTTPAAARARLVFHAMPVGRSVLGRPIDAHCTGSGDRVVLLLGGVHTGYEANSATLVAGLEAAARAGRMAVPPGVWLCFLPALNIDGVTLRVHTNARGVDLNRNWPTADWDTEAYHPATGPVGGGARPLSEPETRALYDFLQVARPELVITWHCCAFLVEANGLPSARALGKQYAALLGVDLVERWTAYRSTGELIRALEDLGIPAIDVELIAPGEPDFAVHLSAVEAVLAAFAKR